jgi:hypothetical protein
LTADEAPVLATAAKLRAEARPAKRTSLVQKPSAASVTTDRTTAVTPHEPGAASQQIAAVDCAALAQNTTSNELPPFRPPQPALEAALGTGALFDEAQRLVQDLGAAMHPFRPKRTYEVLLRKTDCALEAAQHAAARNQMQLRVDHIKTLTTKINTALLWMSRLSSKKHAPKLDTLKAKQALLERLRAELPAHAAEANAYRAKERLLQKQVLHNYKYLLLVPRSR